MDSATLDKLTRDLEGLQGTYQMRFANQPRITRSLGVLDDLIKRAEAIRSALDNVDANGAAQRVSEMREDVEARLERYRAERSAIADAQRNGPAAIEATILGTRANHVIFRYRRHFAGQARNTRDLSLLEELIQDLEALQQEMVNLSATYGQTEQTTSDQQVVREHIALFRREGDAIAQAQAEGTPENRAGLLGGLANNQFDNYRVHFANKTRISRRPELLIRIVATLEFILGEMRGLRDRGLRVDFHDRNIQIVEERIAAYRKELEEIRKVRADSSLDQVLDSLGQAANALMSEYGQEFAGQSRATRSLKRLSELCDQMGEIERQMHRLLLVGSRDDSPWASNLDIVRDALAMFEREYTAIADAQKPAAAAE